MLKKIVNLPLLVKVVLATSLTIIVFIGIFLHEVWTDPAVGWFPLDDTQAEYTITRNCIPAGYGFDEPKTFAQSNIYCMEYRGGHVTWRELQGNANYFSIAIGKSEIDLAPFAEKKVKSIKGNFQWGDDKQCIQNKCINLANGPFPQLNIKSLELAK